MTELALGPRKSLMELCSSNDWEAFYNDVNLRKPKAIDKIVGVIKTCIDSVSGRPTKDIFFKEESFYLTHHPGIFKGFVNNSSIFSHFNNYIKQKSGFEQNYDLTQEERMKYEWNLANNLLRILNAVKEGTEFLLPVEDNLQAYEFIERLKHSPVK